MTLRSGSKPLCETHPEIAAQWHPTRNRDLTPDLVSTGSNKKVWWICEHGHQWEATVYHRTGARSGCPYCSGRSTTEEESLFVRYPQLAAQWHPFLNGKLQASDVRPGSNKLVWWRCEKGHDWRAAVYSRTAGRGCPVCNRKVVTEENCLSTTHQQLCRQWHPTKNGTLSPDKVLAGSHRKAWWICERGHEWEAQIKSRALGGRDCPVCTSKSSRLEIRLFCELDSVLGHGVWRGKAEGFECDLLFPELKIAIEVDGEYWHGRKTRVDAMKSAALQAAGFRLIRLREAGLNPTSIEDLIARPNEAERALVKRFCSHLASLPKLPEEERARLIEYSMAEGFRNDREYRRILSYLPGPPPTESLAALNPRLLSEWNDERNSPLKPTMFSVFSSKSVWWRCSNGHEWKAMIASRSKGNGCPYCAGHLLSHDNTLAVRRPDLVIEWDYTKNIKVSPDQVSSRSKTQVWWRCVKGHSWKASVGERNRGRGCPFCKGKLAFAGESLFDQKPELAAEWHQTLNGDLRPIDVRPFSDKRVWWRCPEGHEWKARVADRSQGTGCPYCAGTILLPERSLKALHPHLAQEWHPTKNGSTDPSQVSCGSNRRAWWRCSKGHEWEAVIYSRVSGRGCPYCAGKKAGQGVSLADQHPELLSEWHHQMNGDLDPFSVTSGAHRKVWWVCPHGHEWQTAVKTRVAGHGCPVCALERKRTRDQ